MLPGRIALTLVAFAAMALGGWRFGQNQASPALDAAFVIMTLLVLVLGIREWGRVLQKTRRSFDTNTRRLSRAYSARHDDWQRPVGS